MNAGPELDRAVALALGYSFDGFAWWTHPDGNQTSVDGLPHYSTDIAAAWLVVENLRDRWTKATAGADGFTDFEHPFDDAVFFEMLHRNADRRWPWAFLYVTPEAICRAALAALETDDAE